MLGQVHLTGNELTAASSAVAAVAIAGGYLGVRSANRNALKIAREERSSRRKDELDALKRTIYVRCLTALDALPMASAQVSASQATSDPANQARMAAQRQSLDEALAVLYNVTVDIQLIAPDPVRVLAVEAMTAAAKSAMYTDSAYTRGVLKLRTAMRYDLQGIDIPSPAELEYMANMAMSEAARIQAGNGKPSTEQD